MLGCPCTHTVHVVHQCPDGHTQWDCHSHRFIWTFIKTSRCASMILSRLTKSRGAAGLHVTYPRDRRRILGDDIAARRFSGIDTEATSPELERLRSGDSSSPDAEASVHADPGAA